MRSPRGPFSPQFNFLIFLFFSRAVSPHPLPFFFFLRETNPGFLFSGLTEHHDLAHSLFSSPLGRVKDEDLFLTPPCLFPESEEDFLLCFFSVFPPPYTGKEIEDPLLPRFREKGPARFQFPPSFPPIIRKNTPPPFSNRWGEINLWGQALLVFFFFLPLV